MKKMIRTNMYFPERMLTRLKKESGALGIPVVDLVRRIIDRHWEMEWVHKSIYILSPTARKLKEEAKKEGIKPSELLQRIIDRYFEGD